MENQEINRSIIKPRPLQHEIIGEVKTCPKCISVFVTEEECESCGYQFSTNYLGKPLDDKSFYTLQENYISDLKRAYFSSTIRDIKKKYVRAVWHRFDVLTEHFPMPDHKDFNFFSYELKSVIDELLNHKVDPERMKIRCTGFVQPALKKYISEVIREWKISGSPEPLITPWTFFKVHSHNLRMWLVVYAWILAMGYLILRESLF